MPSLPDTAVIIVLGLLLFGPKGLAQIARQLGKLMGEFRRASNEFRMQMEEELRIAEQADRQKEIAKIEAAAPVPPPVPPTPIETIAEDHQHLLPLQSDSLAQGESSPLAPPQTEPLPIATSGELSIMPPDTGLPEPRSSSLGSSSLGSLIDSVPKADPHNASAQDDAESARLGEDQRPMRYTNGYANDSAPHDVATEESIHG
jgi:sec-independent protein translocase protein TatB